MKFLITLWTDEIDPFYTGDESFSIPGEFSDLPAAQAYLHNNMDRLIGEQLSQHPGWRLLEQGQYETIVPIPDWQARVSGLGASGIRGLKDNKVVHRRFFKVGDGTFLHSINADFVVIELPSDAVVARMVFVLDSDSIHNLIQCLPACPTPISQACECQVHKSLLSSWQTALGSVLKSPSTARIEIRDGLPKLAQAGG